MTEMRLFNSVLEDSIHPDLILMDYRMPTMNGMQAAEKILRVRPEIKIIIATADDSVRTRCDFFGTFLHAETFLHIGTRQDDRRGTRTNIANRFRASRELYILGPDSRNVSSEELARKLNNCLLRDS